MKKIGIAIFLCLVIVSSLEGASYTGPSKPDQEEAFKNILTAIGVMDPSGFLTNYCDANGVSYNPGHARSV